MTIVHCKKEPYDVYIGRKNKNLQQSKWANPFVIGKDGDRDFCIEKYELWLNTQPELLHSVGELNGRILGCWCFPDKCHGNILEEYSSSAFIKNWFSNMLPMDTSFLYQGIEYKTSENFYQAMKLPKENLVARKEIADMTPYGAKRNIKKYTYRESWNQEESLKVMEYILKIKFRLGTKFHKKLKMTEDWEITEWNNWKDNFWGKDIQSGLGENHLGKLLMKIRDSGLL